MRLRAKIFGAQVKTDWLDVGFVAVGGLRAANVRITGQDFVPPVELGTELIIELSEELGEARPAPPADEKDQRIIDLRRRLAEAGGEGRRA